MIINENGWGNTPKEVAKEVLAKQDRKSKIADLIAIVTEDLAELKEEVDKDA